MRYSMLFMLAGLAVSAHGQSPPAPRVVLNESAAARTSPPSGPLNVIVGKQVQALPQGAEVSVVGRKTYGGFDGTHVWLEVQPAQAAASSPSQRPVWIYGGKQVGDDVVPSGVQVRRN